MNSQKLKQMIKEKESVMAFAKAVDVPYTTLVNSMQNDDRLCRMPIGNFIKVAHGLGMTADELVEALSD